MSASTVSITANPATSRRRPLVAGDKKSGLDLGITEVAPLSGGEIGKESIHLMAREAVASVQKTLTPKSTTPRESSKHPARASSARKKPKWQTVVSVFTKNLLLLVLLAGFVQMIRKLYSVSNANTNVNAGFSGDMEGRIAEVEALVKKTTKMMRVQVEVVDRKIAKVEEKVGEMEGELVKMGVRTEGLEKLVSGNEFMAKGEFERYVEEYSKGKGGGVVDLDEVRAFARGIVEEEIERHAADGLGRVDYALASGGAVVVRYSEPYVGGVKGGGAWFLGAGRNGVHRFAEKMLSPSFGEPGECFPLKGSSGFVQIKLRTAIIPEAITLEHVAKNVAYDRSSAPKDCRVSGWFRGQETTDLDAEKMFSLTEFTYDIEKSNAQTFNVLESDGSGIVDMVRLDFTSNHGSQSHTCIYRLRVHGREPDSIVPFAVQS